MANEYIEKKLSNKKRTVKDLADYIKKNLEGYLIIVFSLELEHLLHQV